LSRAAAGPAQAGSRADQTAGRAGCVKQPASQPGLFGPATDNTGGNTDIIWEPGSTVPDWPVADRKEDWMDSELTKFKRLVAAVYLLLWKPFVLGR
jgi:hypothetical protein